MIIYINEVDKFYKWLGIPVLKEMKEEIYQYLKPNLEKYEERYPLENDKEITIWNNDTQFLIEDIIKIYFYTPTWRISKTAWNYRSSNTLLFDLEENNGEYIIEKWDDWDNIIAISENLLNSKSNELLKRLVRIYYTCIDKMKEQLPNLRFWFITINLKDNLNFKHTKKYWNGDLMSEHEYIIDIDTLLERYPEYPEK